MTTTDEELNGQILFYKDVLESFYTTNYPSVEIEKFWRWFIKMLIGEAKNIEQLNAQEKETFLTKLNDLGDSIFKLPFVPSFSGTP